MPVERVPTRQKTVREARRPRGENAFVRETDLSVLRRLGSLFLYKKRWGWEGSNTRTMTKRQRRVGKGSETKFSEK